ncbi:MAG: potassium channel family protein [Thermoplasmata archaeon]
MFPIFLFFKKFRAKLKSSVYRAAVAAIAVVIYGTFSEYFIENNIPSSGIHSLFDSLWWVMQTVTTVGYGDTPVYGYLGRINAMVIMIFGIGSLGFFTASLAANLMNFQLAKRIGEVSLKMKDHVIICNVDERIRDIVREITDNGMEVVILNKEEPKLDGLPYNFVKGSALEESDLERAGIKSSSKIIILPEKLEGDQSSVDAKSILTCMVVKRLNKNAYVILELLRTENSEHAKMAGADEVVVKGSMSSLMISNAVISPGVSRLFYELLRGDDGFRIREYEIGNKYSGKNCRTVYSDFEDGNRVVLGFRNEKEIKIRPDPEKNVTWRYIIIMEPRDK